MREWSEEEGIDVGKLPASTSLIYQALDRAATFKIGKKKLKKVTASGMWVGDVIVELKMQEAFDELAGGGSNPLVAGAKWHAAATTSEQRKRFIYAILRIKFVLPSAIGPQIVVEGFKLAGQYPLDFYYIMEQCFKSYPRSQFDEIRIRCEDRHVAVMRSEGRLPEAIMNEDHIPTIDAGLDRNNVDRDQRPISNNRAVVLTVENTLATEESRAAARANADMLAEAAKNARARARLDKKEAAKKKKVEKKRKRIEETAKKKAEKAAEVLRNKRLRVMVTKHVNSFPPRERVNERARLMELSVVDRWNELFPGEQIAEPVSLNSSIMTDDSDAVLEAIRQGVNAPAVYADEDDDGGNDDRSDSHDSSDSD